MNRRWLIIVNSAAGRRGSPLQRVSDAVVGQRLDARIVETSSLDQLDAAVASAVEEGITAFASVGGDGSSHHLLNAMRRHGETGPRQLLAIIPAGSGSDFARMFGHRHGDIEAAIGRMGDPDLYPTDIGFVTGSFGERYFLNGIDVGVIATSALKAESLPRWLGGLKYGLALWLALWSFRGGTADVRVDHHRFTGDALTVVSANGQFFGGGFNIAPKATVVDGDLDVQVIHGPKRVAFTIMPRALRGAHLTHTAVRRYVGSEVSISVPDHWHVEADGEILGTGSVEISCLPGAIDYVL